jgi:hypothetical protein
MTLAEQYVEKGIQKGRREGLHLGMQRSIVDALEVRFDRVPPGLAEAIEAISDETRLHSLVRAAITASSIDEFAKSL